MKRKGLLPDGLIIQKILEKNSENDNASVRENAIKILDCIRKKMDELAPSAQGQQKLTRQNAISLLTIFAEVLAEPMVEISDSGVFIEHAAIDLLNQLIDSLRDLDEGKTHLALKSANSGRNASLSLAQRREDQLLLEAVLVVQHAENLKTEDQARQIVATQLRKVRKTRGGESITKGILKGLKGRNKKPL